MDRGDEETKKRRNEETKKRRQGTRIDEERKTWENQEIQHLRNRTTKTFVWFSLKGFQFVGEILGCVFLARSFSISMFVFTICGRGCEGHGLAPWPMRTRAWHARSKAWPSKSDADNRRTGGGILGADISNARTVRAPNG